MLPLPTRLSQVFLDTFSLQACPQPVRFASLLHNLSPFFDQPDSLNDQCRPDIHGRVGASRMDKKLKKSDYQRLNRRDRNDSGHCFAQAGI